MHLERLLRAEEGRILGVFPSHRWPTEDGSHESSVRTKLVTALHQGLPGDARTGALISLLPALRATPKAVPPEALGLSRRELNASAKRMAEGDWAARAVRKAIDGTNAALVAATTSAVVGEGSGSALPAGTVTDRLRRLRPFAASRLQPGLAAGRPR